MVLSFKPDKPDFSPRLVGQFLAFKPFVYRSRISPVRQCQVGFGLDDYFF